MKCVNRTIEVLAHFGKERYPKPFRFRINSDDAEEEFSVINVGKIKSVEENRFCGNTMYIYLCESILNDRRFLYELSFEPKNCIWKLVKI